MIDALARALIEERGFQPVGKLSISGGPELDASLFSFVGIRHYWGSVMSCAIAPLGDDASTAVPRAAEEFSTFTRSLRHYAGRVGFTQLGSFGLLCFVVHT